MCDRKVIQENGKANKRACKTFQKKTSLARLEVQDATGIWKQIQGKEQIEEHIAQQNMEQFSHAGKTPLVYTPLGEELGHTGDTQLSEDILTGTLEHESLRDEAIQ
jgi:hypothetical protein